MGVAGFTWPSLFLSILLPPVGTYLQGSIPWVTLGKSHSTSGPIGVKLRIVVPETHFVDSTLFSNDIC